MIRDVTTLHRAEKCGVEFLRTTGRYDFFCPVEASQEPFYRLLGPRQDQKKHLLYDASHIIPMNELIKEELNWFDQYLGRVN